MDTLPAILAFPQAPGDRLRLALRRLDDALAEQAAAIAEFRSGLGALKQATRDLAGSLGQYRVQLDSTQAQVAQANLAARQLHETARQMEARAE
jgi:chromosome segregation ATPase